MADSFTNRFKAAQEAARAARLAKTGGSTAPSGPVTGSALTAKMQAVRDRMAAVNAIKPTVYAPDPPKRSRSIFEALGKSNPSLPVYRQSQAMLAAQGVNSGWPYTAHGTGSDNGGFQHSTSSNRSSSGGGIGGYTGLRDMVDGGGPGRSGSTFSGGGLVSGALNAAGVSPVGSSKSSGKSTSSTKK